jgi:hypothetical protein
MTLNQHLAQKTRRFNEFHGIGRIEDAVIEQQNAAIDADEDAALDELAAVAHLLRVGKSADLIRVPANRFVVDLPGFTFRTATTYAAIAREAAAAIKAGAPYVTIRYSEDGTFFSELWTKQAAQS